MLIKIIPNLHLQSKAQIIIHRFLSLKIKKEVSAMPLTFSFRIKFLLSLFYILIAYTISGQVQKQPVDTLKYRSNPIYSQQLAFYDLYKTKKTDIIMLGNSLTHGVDWGQLLGRTNVVGMGITSDVLRGYMARLDYVFKLKPKIVFIMGGLNDIYNWTPVEEIYTVYIRLIEKIKSKGIIPVIQSTTYASKNYAKDWGGTPEVNSSRNKEVDKLNKLLQEYAKKNKIDFVDLNPKISRMGYLKEELTWDGIHLKAEAYRFWRDEVESILIKHKL